MGDWEATREAYLSTDEVCGMKIYDMSDDYRKLIASLLPFVTDELALYELYVKVLMLSGKGTVNE